MSTSDGDLRRAVFAAHGDKANRTRKWYQWHDPGMSKEERKLVSKLDFYILLYTCLVSFHLCGSDETLLTIFRHSLSSISYAWLTNIPDIVSTNNI